MVGANSASVRVARGGLATRVIATLTEGAIGVSVRVATEGLAA